MKSLILLPLRIVLGIVLGLYALIAFRTSEERMEYLTRLKEKFE